jgi:hypothetical protein
MVVMSPVAALVVNVVGGRDLVYSACIGATTGLRRGQSDAVTATASVRCIS